MPELPEVETVRRRLAARLPGRVLQEVVVHDATVSGQTEAELRSLLAGRRVEGLRRRGKYLLVDLAAPAGVAGGLPTVAVVHLRMTGQLLFCPEPSSQPPRFVWRFERGVELHFRDVRRFGRLWAIAPDAESEFFAGMGPEPFGEHFDVACLRAALAGRTAPLKSFLLDQRRIAGVGNIYADEALFRARLNPLRAAGGLGPREARRLHAAILEALQAGIDHEGASIESFVDPASRRGRFQEILNVYQRTGGPCRVCGAPIQRVVVGGRGTHFCPRCQPQRGRMAPSARGLRGSATPSRGGGPAAAVRRSYEQGGREPRAGLTCGRPAGDANACQGPGTSSGRASARPSPRLYVVATWVPRRASLIVGALGSIVLPRGWYAYVGSAARLREARVARHLTSRKTVRWHADYLFASYPARAAWLVDGAEGECVLARALAGLSGAERYPRGFGAGDCRCRGHLVRLSRRPGLPDIALAAGAGAAVRAFG